MAAKADYAAPYLGRMNDAGRSVSDRNALALVLNCMHLQDSALLSRNVSAERRVVERL